MHYRHVRKELPAACGLRGGAGGYDMASQPHAINCQLHLRTAADPRRWRPAHGGCRSSEDVGRVKAQRCTSEARGRDSNPNGRRNGGSPVGKRRLRSATGDGGGLPRNAGVRVRPMRPRRDLDGPRRRSGRH